MLLLSQNSISFESFENLEMKGILANQSKLDLEKMVKAHEKFVSNVTCLAESIGEPMIETINIYGNSASSENLGDFEEESGIVSVSLHSRNTENLDALESSENYLWEDELTRQFYESLVPIESSLPSMLFKKDATPSSTSDATNVTAPTVGGDGVGEETTTTAAS
eukprot:Sdes_comp17297_c0_seq4m6499